MVPPPDKMVPPWNASEKWYHPPFEMVPPWNGRMYVYVESMATDRAKPQSAVPSKELRFWTRRLLN
jgi:hypothetical protein